MYKREASKRAERLIELLRKESNLNWIACRTFAVYAVGSGWTGAFGNGRFDQEISGHNDEEEAGSPLKIYDGSVKDISLGWGHTAILTEDRRLLLAGRPHDFSVLLRLRRLPLWVRNYAINSSINEFRGLDSRSVHPIALIGRLITWLAIRFKYPTTELEAARRHSIFPELAEIALPDSEVPSSVSCSAALTAIVTESGKVYAFGLNGFGQCGIGMTSNHVWNPSLPLRGLTSEFANQPRGEMEQSYPVVDVALGLQHGICLNEVGEVFCWGKGERGQLGQGLITTEAHTALPVKRAFTLGEKMKPQYQTIGQVTQIDAGMIHCAALTKDNEVLIWGKHVLPLLPGDENKKVSSDARLPYILPGLPKGVRVERIACGSHHTAILLDDGSVYAAGIATHTKEPIHEAVQILPPGVVNRPVRQFDAHMDRTTIVGADGRQVLQLHLWKDEELREFAAFTPAWVDHILDENPFAKISMIHRSWIHSVVVTEEQIE
jgi:alpha-tubulin suppressor-like RCC1 family protein